jgi:hypothetical protein
MTNRSAVTLLILATAIATGCAGTQIGDPNGYQPVPLNRVFPYPTSEELAAQKIEVVLAAQYADDLPRAQVATAMKPLLGSVEKYLSDAGAGVIDRSIHDLANVRDELVAAEGGSGATFTGADWAIVARIDKLRHRAVYEPPSSLFKNAEELKEEPGTCKHTGEVEARLRAFKIPTDDVPRATLILSHSDGFEESEFDQNCPIPPDREELFLEGVLKEALPCLEAPLKNGFAPLGYVEEHRAKEAKNIYRTSMGRLNGATPNLELQIFRAQYMTTRDNEKIRTEKQIGEAIVSEQIGDRFSWIVVNLKDLKEPILDGDLVRAVYDDPRSSALGGGICKKALRIQGTL